MRDDMREIRISQIAVADNIRSGELDVDDLKESIRDRGLLQPILVRRHGDGYELVAGHRRLEACKRLGMTMIRALVHDACGRDRRLLQFAENIQREDVPPYDIGCALREMLKSFEHIGQLGHAIRKQTHWVADHLRYAELRDELRAAGEQIERVDCLCVATMLELSDLKPADRHEIICQATAVEPNGKVKALSTYRVRRLIDAQAERAKQDKPRLGYQVREHQKPRRQVGAVGPFTFSVMAKTIVVACETDAVRERLAQILLERGGRQAS